MTRARRRWVVATLLLDDILNSNIHLFDGESDERFQRVGAFRLDGSAGFHDVHTAFDDEIDIDDDLLLTDLYFYRVVRAKSLPSIRWTAGFADRHNSLNV